MSGRDRQPHAAALVELGRALQAAGYHFTTVTPLTHGRVLARDPAARARSLRDVFGWNRAFCMGRQDAWLTPHLAGLIERSGIALPVPRTAGGDGDSVRSTLRCATLDGQLFFHSAFPTDDKSAVFFGPDTYRFIRALRAESALPQHAAGPAPRRIADLGCGAGPAAIVLAGLYPDAEVLAIDINDAALALTEVNAALAGAGKLRAVNSDLLDGVQGDFDLIVANPPYLLDQSRRSYRHGGGELGEALAVRIISTALARLNPGGTLMLYTGVAMVDGEDVLLRRAAPLLDGAQCTWRYQEIDPDVFGEELAQDAYSTAERIAAVWLTLTKC